MYYVYFYVHHDFKYKSISIPKFLKFIIFIELNKLKLLITFGTEILSGPKPAKYSEITKL